MLFLCPPALQAWALSDIPTVQGCFPSESLLGNFDYLLLRAKKNGVPDNLLARFPWISWFIWKARNELLFNGKQILPPDTVLHATREEESWRVAQVIAEKGGTGSRQISEQGNSESESPFPRCQVDASWVKNSKVSGGGFVFDLSPDTHLYGSFGMEQVLSPMHAEFNILLSAMRNSLQLGYTSMSFESDCLQLVKLINDEEDWPSMASEWNEFTHLFPSFTLHICDSFPDMHKCVSLEGASAGL
ncbi:hypothetical protein Bca52824_016679 [Brassica carinata]|uniref:RNase H type-1 domain-containing protein n=1 Tax=Brassica carinata TaxID=52824 RepID=A0A8X7W4G9_BRACI|nr:hypothetical protein Bca52824_016679 [Brassica carinata]